MTKPAPLLPLAYCRIERAARLLNCEVEDILHWCSLGVIEGAFWIYDAPCTPVFQDKNKIVEDENEYEKRLDTLFNLHDINHQQRRSISLGINSKLTMSPQPKKQSLEPIIFADGFWSPGKKLFEFMLFQRKTSLTEWGLSPAWADQKSNFMSIFLPESEDDHAVEPSQIWIFKRDLDLLEKHIRSGEPLPYNEHQQPEHPNKKTVFPHPVAERHAANREQVLAAAIYAMRNPDWKDELDDTATNWAQKVINHEHVLFDENKCPLSPDTVERLLSSALVTGKTRRGR